ncbi:ATP-grasp fold amidoligase family protein [Bradyrhizobium sp. HKCCYLRH3099]|uniref:ATP-grasp fold amidoligase family protein n=1 Tax=unclassified Bradyrhizobium TaxID=2631580 RepID=UPI003EC061FA
MTSIEHYASRLAPNMPALNAIFVARHFKRIFGRSPKPLSHPGADYHDFIVDRMIRGHWTDRHLRCVDKEHAKSEAIQLHPTIRVPETRAIIPVPRQLTFEDFSAAIEPFLGQHLVAKPTHGSAATEFLDAKPDIFRLYRTARYNYFYSFRETQYFPLKHKVIVEDNISDDGVDLRDFKFFCSYGRILFVQIDANRFTEHERILVAPPHFQPMNLRLGAFKPTTKWVRPEALPDLCKAAEALSRPFDFVRIDLYEKDGHVYLGEFTFTPGAGMEPFSDPDFSKRLLDEIKHSTSREPAMTESAA